MEEETPMVPLNGKLPKMVLGIHLSNYHHVAEVGVLAG